MILERLPVLRQIVSFGAIAILTLSLVLPVQAAAVPDGAKIFESQCAGCHINGGNIVRRGKTLKLKALQKNGYETVDAIAQIVTQGKGNMSAYQDRLTPADIQAVANYVMQQALNDWH